MMRSTTGLRIALLLAATLTAVSCTSTPPTGGATPTPIAAATEAASFTAAASVPQASVPVVVSTDPCALVTEDEAATFLGGPIVNHSKKTSEALPGVNLTTCTFNTASAAGILVIGLARPVNSSFWDQFLAAPEIKSQLQPVSGIGDAAWFFGPTGDQAMLIVRKGDALVEVLATLKSGASTDDLDKQVAQLALTRL